MPLQARPTKSSDSKIIVSVHCIVNFNLKCCKVNFNLKCCKGRRVALEDLSARSLALDKVSDCGVPAIDSVVIHAQLQRWHSVFALFFPFLFCSIIPYDCRDVLNLSAPCGLVNVVLL